MKTKYLFLISILFLCSSFSDVHASSINYNLQIDSNMNFHEKIIYNIDSKDIKRDGSYHFLTNVLDNPIYFDLKEELRYKKSKSSASNGYVVTLQYDYPYMFLSKSRILNECFTNKQINNNASYISLNASDFYCSHRADNIKVVINTPLTVSSSNANTHNGNSYIWNNITDQFSLNFKVQIPPIEEEPMHSLDDEESNIDNNTDNESNNKKQHISVVVILSMIGVIFVLLLFGFVMLKKKKEQLDDF